MPGFIPWVGGKSRLAPVIIQRMPPHKSYIEVFGGGGWVLFNKGKIKGNYIVNSLERMI